MTAKNGRTTGMWVIATLVLGAGCSEPTSLGTETGFVEFIPGNFDYFVALHKPCQISPRDYEIPTRETYDELGRLIRSVDDDYGMVTEVSYNDEEHVRVTKTTSTGGIFTLPYLRTEAVDEATEIEGYTLVDGLVVSIDKKFEVLEQNETVPLEFRWFETFERNALSQIKAITRDSVTEGWRTKEEYTYDPFGNLARKIIDAKRSAGGIDLGWDATTEYRWNADGLMDEEVITTQYFGANPRIESYAMRHRYDDDLRLVATERTRTSQYQGGQEFDFTTMYTFEYDCDE